MAHALYRLGRLAHRRWPAFLIGWLVVLVAIGGAAATMSQPMSDKFSIPGIESEQAQNLQQELFPQTQDAFDQATGTVVVQAPEGEKLSDPANSAAVDDLLAELREAPQVGDPEQFVNPVTAAAGLERQMLAEAKKNGQPQAVAETNAAALSPLTEDGRTGLIQWNFDVDTVTDVEQSSRDAVTEAVDDARDAGLTAEVTGTGMQGTPEMGMTSELIGIAVALLVLVLTFGSLVAAGLPILTALVGVGTGILGITAATAFFDLGTTTPILASMLGLAVGIDYALFILSRYRTELRHTDDRQHAIGLAVGRAGSAVVFAGLTVIIALAALAVVQIPFLTAMGLAAAGTVLVAVLVALTLLPAIVGALGTRAFAGQIRKNKVVDEGEHVDNGGTRWARAIGAHPIIAALVAVLALGALAVPAKDLHLALPSDSTAAADTSQRRAADLIADGFGVGQEARMVVVVDGRDLEDPRQAPAAYGQVVEWLSGFDGVANAQVVGMNEEGTGAQLLVTPKTGAADEATETLLTDIRAGQGQQEEITGTTIGVTGLTAIQTDVSEKLQNALLPYLGVVVGLAFVLLMLVFRSLLVPLTATLGFVLSTLGTVGATVLIFQEGALGLVDGAPLVSFLPILMIGIVFGLAMDYQVFLVTRMREAYVHGDTAREAVVDGFRHGARVVTAAALIMISVFAAFMLQPDNLIKSMGFALAAAVLLDAFVVRMTLIPALMYLMGDAAWSMPRWLDRLLPNVDVEGEALTQLTSAARTEDRPVEEPAAAR
ncbi:MMPL family transporter [Janibacter indicus]|uniref:Putative drug exporter of the RND superfamily n=1 Tax=Janibacter indicus TaxID=857417 RepID=A0A1W1YRK5_9MICO|nr:MMPL family transporter [Janibacter indicus]SMC38451.1 putative drug exporter of the RND superfamily [Janibacter indicus]